MTKSQGYKSVFDKAAALADGFTDFENFRQYPDLFHFIIAPSHQRSPDQEALDKAKTLSPETYKALVDKGPSYGNQLDAVESRHILMMCFLQSKIGNDWGNVVEIGGGYGNWVRLAQDVIEFNSWCIIDIPHVTQLQKSLLSNYKNVTFNEVHDPIKVTIGAHSMSEFALEDFLTYLALSIKSGTKYFLYVAHNTSPDPVILLEKLKMLSLVFDLVATAKYEGNNCTMYLGQRKGYL